MSYTIGGVSLPAPSKISKRLPAKVEPFEVSGLPILIVPNLNAIELTIEGVLVGDKATTETTYLLPLEALKGTEVTVAFPDSRYNGSWVLANFTYAEENAKKFSYSLQLMRGSSHIIL